MSWDRQREYSMVRIGIFFSIVVVTEIQTLKVLWGVSATHVATGGLGGSEGSVVLTIEGMEENVDRAFVLVKALKGEPALSLPDHL